MKLFAIPVRVVALSLCACTLGCDSKNTKPDSKAANAAKAKEASSDLPLLPLKDGDLWRFEVTTENAADGGKISRTARVRRYLGKVEPREKLAPADCFETTTLGRPQILEYMDISETKITLRGTQEVGAGGLRWLGDGVPIYWDGLKTGSTSRFSSGSGAKPGAGASFELSLVGREPLVTPVGAFDTVKLLLLSRSDSGQSRRTLWFSPGNGFIQEENAYYSNEALVMRETVVLKETNRSLRLPNSGK